MKRRVAFTGLLLFVFAAPAIAATGTDAVPQTDQQGTQIVTDQKNNIIKVLIGGRDVLTIDARGLHVNGNIAYSGTLNSAPARAKPDK